MAEFRFLTPKVEDEELDSDYGTSAAIEVSTKFFPHTPSRSLLRQNQYAFKLLQDYCAEAGVDSIDFSQIAVPDLDRLLAKFVMKARTRRDGELFRLSTFTTLQHALSRHLFEIRNVSIRDEREFPEYNEALKLMQKFLEAAGKGDSTSIRAIADADFMKMMDYFRMVIETPTGLQQFLFWNIVRHLHVGGRDKLAALRKADFIFTDDHLGNRYVRVNPKTLGDEAADSKNVIAWKPEDPLCPLTAFERYLTLLPQDVERFFLQPNRDWRPNVPSCTWYSRCVMGKNLLGDMMKTISTAAGLSQIYTNHSIALSVASSNAELPQQMQYISASIENMRKRLCSTDTEPTYKQGNSSKKSRDSATYVMVESTSGASINKSSAEINAVRILGDDVEKMELSPKWLLPFIRPLVFGELTLVGAAMITGKSTNLIQSLLQQLSGITGLDLSNVRMGWQNTAGPSDATSEIVQEERNFSNDF